MQALLFFVGLTLGGYVVQCLAVWLVTHGPQAPRATFPRTLLAVFLATVAGLGLAGLGSMVPTTTLGAGLLLGVVQAAVCAMLLYWLIHRILGVTWIRAGLGWVASCGVSIMGVLVGLFLIRPFLLEAFYCPTNGMAPTLRGEHRLATCPGCGGPLVTAVPDPRLARPEATALGICGQCLQTSRVIPERIPPLRHEGDHFVVDKLATPRRWDVVAYHFRPDTVYMQRLVGLPGDTLVIQDGRVWVNGVAMTPPGELARLVYTIPAGATGPSGVRYAAPDHPVHLGPEEYFLLGDFSEQSYDCRWLGPVHRSALIGPITVTYWPLARFHLFR